MARPAVDRQTRLRAKIEATPELVGVSRKLAALALAQQDHPLSPREREDLRRGLAAAGEALDWAHTLATNADPVEEFALDVRGLAEIGIESLESDLADERANKQTEASRLGDVVAYARNLSADAKATYPVEITYPYTVRDPYQGLVTKTAKTTVTNSHEALSAAEALQRSIEGRSKLADLMVIDLDERRGRLQAMTRKIPEFVESSTRLLTEVVANLS